MRVIYYDTKAKVDAGIDQAQDRKRAIDKIVLTPEEWDDFANQIDMSPNHHHIALYTFYRNVRIEKE